MVRLIVLFFSLIISINAARADEIARTKLGQVGDPLTPAQSKSTCNGWNSGDFPWGGGWKTCASWKTEWRHIENEYFLVANGPNLGAEARNAVQQCFVVAAGAAAAAGYATGSAAAIPAAKVAFSGCLAVRTAGLADKYDITIETSSHWTDWS